MPPKSLLILLFLLVMPFASAQFFCEDLKDCPAPECITSVRTCESKLCEYSPCVLTNANTPSKADEAEQSDFDHYMEIVGLSSKDRENSVFKSMGVLSTFRSLKWSGFLIAGSLVLVMLVMMAKMGPMGKMVIAVVAVAIILGGVIQMGTTLFVKDPDTLWKRTKSTDFVNNDLARYDEKVMGSQFRDSISSDLIDVRTYRRIQNKEERVIGVLEFDNASAVDEWKVRGGYLFAKDSVYGETVYTAQVDPPTSQHNRVLSLWDEDRFVFVAVGTPGITREEVVQVVKNYPYRSSQFFSRLTVTDNSPPEIYNIQPPHNGATEKNRLSFWVADDLNLVRDSIKVTGISGFDIDDCEEDIDAAYYCDFETNYQPGFNSFTISASDKTGNRIIKEMTVYLDSIPPQLLNISPELGEYTNESRVIFDLGDDFGIDRDEIEVAGLEGFENGRTDCYHINHTHVRCPFISEALDGANNFQIRTKDTAGNQNEFDHYFVYVGEPKVQFIHPKQDSYTNRNDVSFTLHHENVQPLKAILVSHGNDFEDITGTCIVTGRGFEADYACNKELPFETGPETVTVSIVEADDVVFKIPLSFTFDDIAPTVQNVSVEQKEKGVYVTFNLTDAHSGVDIDTFSLQDLSVFTMDMDCVPVDKVYTCYVDLFDLEEGLYPFTVEVFDNAGNRATHPIEAYV